MKQELHRLASFAKSSKLYKTHELTLPSQLASAGLYYIHKVDSVACFNCDWRCKIGDLYNAPVEQHRKKSPRCDATGNKAAGNVPFGSLDGSNRRLARTAGSMLGQCLQCLTNISPSSAYANDGNLAAVPFVLHMVDSDCCFNGHVTHYHSPDSSSDPLRE